MFSIFEERQEEVEAVGKSSGSETLALPQLLEWLPQ